MECLGPLHDGAGPGFFLSPQDHRFGVSGSRPRFCCGLPAYLILGKEFYGRFSRIGCGLTIQYCDEDEVDVFACPRGCNCSICALQLFIG